MPIQNFILDADSYKASHFLQYPPGTERVNSYIESRGISHDPFGEAHGGPMPDRSEVCFFGLQAFLTDYLEGTIIDEDLIEAAKEFFVAHGEPFNEEGWKIILNEHGGKLPIEIQAVPEGLCLPPHNVLVQVVNTDTKVPWLTSYVETALLRAVWYPTTVATLSREVKKTIYKFLKATCENPDQEILYKLHDFGARGVSSNESSALGGCAHLVNFRGSDTMMGIVGASYWYDEDMAGVSIPAAEHSTITAWGPAHEADAYRNMLDRFAKPGKLVAVVSDSYDIMNAVTNIWGRELRDRVKSSGATLVIRPDSGNPSRTVVDILERLRMAFGDDLKQNAKGFLVLPPYLRVIQGDGVNRLSIDSILENMMLAGWSAENVAFGMGGALLQQVNRDTLKFAMKASAIQVNGEWRDVFKRPVGDPSKASRGGRMALRAFPHVDFTTGDNKTAHGVSYQTVPLNDCPDSENLLRPVFRNGEILVRHKFSAIRERAAL